MSRQLIIRPEAESEMDEARTWYEERRPGLGAAFLLSVEATMCSIQNNPFAYPVIHKELRRALIRRFPYAIYYLTDPSAIVVVAVFHAKRNPVRWQERV